MHIQHSSLNIRKRGHLSLVEEVKQILGMDSCYLLPDWWGMEIHNYPGNNWVDYPNVFMDLLEGKYDLLREVGIEPADILIRNEYEFYNQCNDEFDLETMHRMGSNGIGLAVTAWVNVDLEEAASHESLQIIGYERQTIPVWPNWDLSAPQEVYGHYSWNIIGDEDSFSCRVTKIMQLPAPQGSGKCWTYTYDEDYDGEEFDFIGFCLEALSGKEGALTEEGIGSMHILASYEYYGLWTRLFLPQQLLKMAEKDISLCVTCW